MIRAIILVLISLFCLSSCKEYSIWYRAVKKSQRNYYYNNHIDKAKFTFFEDTRRRALKELQSQSTDNFYMEGIHFIEAFDVTSGELNGMIQVGEKRYFYKSDMVSRNFGMSMKPSIDSTTIKSFIDGKFKELHDPMNLSSILYIGTKVNHTNKGLLITHYHW